MKQHDPKKQDTGKEQQQSNIKPDPETLGPEPQDHMEGPVSSVVKKVGEAMDKNDKDKPKDEKEKWS